MTYRPRTQEEMRNTQYMCLKFSRKFWMVGNPRLRKEDDSSIDLKGSWLDMWTGLYLTGPFGHPVWTWQWKFRFYDQQSKGNRDEGNAPLRIRRYISMKYRIHGYSARETTVWIKKRVSVPLRTCSYSYLCYHLSLYTRISSKNMQRKVTNPFFIPENHNL